MVPLAEDKGIDMADSVWKGWSDSNVPGACPVRSWAAVLEDEAGVSS
jgi:hypothetical protein